VKEKGNKGKEGALDVSRGTQGKGEDHHKKPSNGHEIRYIRKGEVMWDYREGGREEGKFPYPNPKWNKIKEAQQKL
jgi:hypothetical protein